MSKKKLPQEVLCQWSDDAGDTRSPDVPFLLVYKNDEEACEYNGKRVGVYQLIEVVDISSKPGFTRKPCR